MEIARHIATIWGLYVNFFGGLLLRICWILRQIHTFFPLVAPQHFVEYDIPRVSYQYVFCTNFACHSWKCDLLLHRKKGQTQLKNLRTRLLIAHLNACLTHADRIVRSVRTNTQTDANQRNQAELTDVGIDWALIQANYPLKVSQHPNIYHRVSRFRTVRSFNRFPLPSLRHLTILRLWATMNLPALGKFGP